MKIYNKIIIILLVVSVTFMGCEDFLDVNNDPNNPTEVSEALLLTGILSNFTYQVLAGYPARVTNAWIKQTAFNAVPPSYDTYQVTENDANNLWTYFSYTDVMMNCKVLDELALQNKAYDYAGVAKVIWAWNMSIITDLYGNAPFSQALDLNTYPKPVYDTQEEIYNGVLAMLDSAIADFNRPDKNLGKRIGANDFIYKGDATKWKKLAYTLKARLHMHLTYAPGKNAQTQADLALKALANGFISNADDAKYPYLNEKGQENPWFQYARDGKWNLSTQLSKFFLDMLQDTGDPRLHAYFELHADNYYKGHINGETQVANVSFLGNHYAAANASVDVITFVEAKFLEAEAQFIMGDMGKARQALEDGLKASFSKLRVPMLDNMIKIVEGKFKNIKVDGKLLFIDDNGTVIRNPEFDDMLSSNPTTSKDIATVLVDSTVSRYISNRKGGITAKNASSYEMLMNAKYSSNFLQFETYNDWRRTGYPKLEPVSDPYVPATRPPVRFPYPSAELNYNTENVNKQNIPAGINAVVIPVWWMTGDCTICGF